MKPRKPIRKATPTRAKELAKYRRLKLKFLGKSGQCAKCGGYVYPWEGSLHHFYGRVGSLLTWVPGFRLVHSFCHTWIESNRNEAVKLGLRAPDNLFNRASKVIPK